MIKKVLLWPVDHSYSGRGGMLLLLPLTSRAVQVGVLLREAFDALVFVGAWVGVALTVVVPVEANVKFLTFWFGLRFFRMALAFSAGAIVSVMFDRAAGCTALDFLGPTCKALAEECGVNH